MVPDVSSQFPEDFYHDPVGVDRYVVQEKSLFEWMAPSKPERAHQKSEIAQYILIIVIIALILLLLNDIVLSLVFSVGALLWLGFLLSKASFLRCQVTTIGIKVEDQYYFWYQLSQFWFETKSNTRFLYLRNLASKVGYVRIIIDPSDEDTIQTMIGKYLLYKKPHQTAYQKFIEQIYDKLPFGVSY